jgi:predicted protein tyrosine phosphatase
VPMENSQTANTQTPEKQSVLFLCTGNSARSQMGEAWLRHYANEEFEIHSAGLDPSVVNPFTIQVMSEKGIDMSAHHAKSVREYLGKKRLYLCHHGVLESRRTLPPVPSWVSFTASTGPSMTRQPRKAVTRKSSPSSDKSVTRLKRKSNTG